MSLGEIVEICNVKNRYLGFKFMIKGEAHFGWARLNVTCTTMYQSHKVTGVSPGYAYETTPNKGIVMGKTKSSADESGVEKMGPASLNRPISKPASLGLLAAGSRGLFIWRRKDGVLEAN